MLVGLVAKNAILIVRNSPRKRSKRDKITVTAAFDGSASAFSARLS